MSMYNIEYMNMKCTMYMYYFSNNMQSNKTQSHVHVCTAHSETFGSLTPGQGFKSVLICETLCQSDFFLSDI